MQKTFIRYGIDVRQPILHLAVFFSLASFAPGQVTKEQAPEPLPAQDLFRATLSEREQKLIDAINRERRAEEASELKVNPRLMAAARLHAENMAKLDQGSHELEDIQEEWQTPAGRLAYVKWQGMTWGENIAWGSGDAEIAVRNWMKSEGHRKNILNGDFTEIGVGLARGPTVPYWCAVFGGPVAKQPDRKDEKQSTKDKKDGGVSAQGASGEKWRYRWHQGRWWYWLPENRWVVWVNGRWMEAQ
jgi:uncharacterized protein YkwD